MSAKQLAVLVIVLAVACCAIMWALEDFRQRKMLADFAAELAKLPTYLSPEQQHGG